MSKPGEGGARAWKEGKQWGLKTREKKAYAAYGLQNPQKNSRKTKNKAYALKSQPKPKERGQFLPILYLEGTFFGVFFVLFFKSYVL